MGRVPAAGTLNLDGVDVSEDALEKLFHVDRNMWTAECDLTEEYFEQFGNRVPEALTEELAQLRGRLTT
jgi:phosphoenolpyruvate carboxykinase (GTP)